MQTNRMPVWAAPALAFHFSFVVLHALLMDYPPSKGDAQWALWGWCLLFSAMFSFAFLVAEYGLAKRSKALSFQAYTQLTRDADVSTKWRILAWTGIWNVLVVAGGVALWTSGMALVALPDAWLHILAIDNWSGTFAICTLVLGVLAMALSFVPRKILLLVGVVASVIATILAAVDGLTWSLATSMRVFPALIFAFVISGLGLGMYWQNWLNTEQTMIKTVLPTFGAQVSAIAAVFISCGISPENIGQVVMSVIAGVALMAVLFNMARKQLQSRFSVVISTMISLLPLVILAFCSFFIRKVGSHTEFLIFWNVVVPILLIMILGILLHPFLFSIFVGWKMKNSQLRHAVQFSHNIHYHIWRVFIRFIMPLAIIVFVGTLVWDI